MINNYVQKEKNVIECLNICYNVDTIIIKFIYKWHQFIKLLLESLMNHKNHLDIHLHKNIHNHKKKVIKVHLLVMIMMILEINLKDKMI